MLIKPASIAQKVRRSQHQIKTPHPHACQKLIGKLYRAVRVNDRPPWCRSPATAIGTNCMKVFNPHIRPGTIG